MDRSLIVEAFGLALDTDRSSLDGLFEDMGLSTEERAEVLMLLEQGSQAEHFLDDFAPASSILPEATEDRVGAKVGPYRLVCELGRGGMGTVFLAERDDGQFDREVALKLIKRGMDSDAIQRRFLQERQILAGLEHPGIARLFEGGLTDDGRPYFAMEYVRGVPITDYCAEHRLSVEQRLRLVRDVGRAVQFAHSRLVVHRDLKPSNILVEADGSAADEHRGAAVAKLVDFGIARVLELEDADALTRTHQRLFTPRYAAPEQVVGEPTTVATDVFGLGVVLYELLTGCLPFPRPDPAHARDAYTQPPQRPSTMTDKVGRSLVNEYSWDLVARERRLSGVGLRKRLRGDLDAIVLRALAPDPQRRYSSMEAFVEDIERHLTGLPVRAQQDSLGYRTWKFVSRHKVEVAAVALVVSSLLLGLIGTAWQARRAEREAERAVTVKEFVLDLFRTSSPNETKGETLTASDLLERGVERIETELDGRAPLQAEMLMVLGRVYGELGQFEQAEALLLRALALEESLSEPRPIAAEMNDELGKVVAAQGRFDEAEERFKSGLLIRQTLLGASAPELANSLNALAVLEMERDQHAEAVPLLEQALAIRIAALGEDDPASVLTRQNLAGALASSGRLEEAVSLQRDILRQQIRILGAEHSTVATAMANLGLSLTGLGETEDAREFLEQSLETREQLFGPLHPDVANSLHYLAYFFGTQGEHARVVEFAGRARDIQVQNFGPDHPSVAGLSAMVEQATLELQNTQ